MRLLPAGAGNLPDEERDKAEGRSVRHSADIFQRMKSAANNRLPGQHLFENFVTEDEERQLIEYIDTCEPTWHLSTFNGPHGCVTFHFPPNECRTCFLHMLRPTNLRLSP